MRPIRAVLFLLLFVFSTGQAKADQWEDPSWRMMIDSSDVIALVKYVSNGGFRAEAQLLKVYKGSLKTGDRIWITGFSGRYGPDDSVSIGDTYVVFLNHNMPNERRIEYWNEQLKESPELLDYVTAYKDGKSYSVWTPTAGDLRVKGSKVQYDLLQTSYYSKQLYQSLNEFEELLGFALKGKGTDLYYQKILTALKKDVTNEQAAQSLAKLYLTGYTIDNPVFKTVKLNKYPTSRFALALLLGMIKTEVSRQQLVDLLEDKNSIVQGEAVRQLSSEPPAFLGPILLKRLKGAGKGVLGPSNIMDPVTNTLNGGQIEIIETLGKIKYKAAAKELIPLLETNDNYLFELLVETLKELGSDGYTPYLSYHLNEKTDGLIFKVFRIATEDSLTECIPAMMNYISTHNRFKHPSKEYTVSKHSGLAHFNIDSVRRFLVNDFKTVLNTPQKVDVSIDSKQKWVEEYAETFKDIGIDTLKPYFYDFLQDYYGINHLFKSTPQLFEVKKHLEDSIAAIALSVLPKDSVLSVITLVILEESGGPEPTIKDYVLKYKAAEDVSFDHMNKLLKSKGILQKYLIASSGNYSMLYSDRKLLDFDDGLMRKVLEYISTYPDKGDLEFMQNLEKYGYADSEYEKRRLKEFIQTAKDKLK